MKSSITKGLTPEKKTIVCQEFIGSYTLREVLRELLEDKRRVSFDTAGGKEAYGSASWPFMQADARGYERAMKEVISLLSEET